MYFMWTPSMINCIVYSWYSKNLLLSGFKIYFVIFIFWIPRLKSWICHARQWTLSSFKTDPPRPPFLCFHLPSLSSPKPNIFLSKSSFYKLPKYILVMPLYLKLEDIYHEICLLTFSLSNLIILTLIVYWIATPVVQTSIQCSYSSS